MFKIAQTSGPTAAPPAFMTSGFADSSLAISLVQAYRETDYRVQMKDAEKQSFVLKVGVHCGPLGGLQRATGVECSAFITACNPWSRTLTDALNAQRMEGLIEVLNARSLRWYPGIGQHPTNGCPAEPSLLVMGLSLAAARVLAASFEQNAIVWSSSDAVPQLILLR